MTTITASLVKELRERTAAGMMECKKALMATEGDIELAIENMRKSGQAKAAKKAGRVAAEGILHLASNDDNTKAAMVEVNCETDFVARDASFIEFVKQVTDRALATASSDVESLLSQTYGQESDKTIEQARADLVVKIGENIQVRRIHLVTGETVVGHYLHGDRIGVLVNMKGGDAALARDAAMHVAASNPEAIDSTGVSADLLAKEKDIFIAQAIESGKPKDIAEKMVEGRMKKYLKEICLVDQPFVKNPDQTVGQLLGDGSASIVNFTRFEVGEGIEKKVDDFVGEVMAQARGE